MKASKRLSAVKQPSRRRLAEIPASNVVTRGALAFVVVTTFAIAPTPTAAITAAVAAAAAKLRAVRVIYRNFWVRVWA